MCVATFGELFNGLFGKLVFPIDLSVGMFNGILAANLLRFYGKIDALIGGTNATQDPNIQILVQWVMIVMPRKTTKKFNLSGRSWVFL